MIKKAYNLTKKIKKKKKYKNEYNKNIEIIQFNNNPPKKFKINKVSDKNKNKFRCRQNLSLKLN